MSAGFHIWLNCMQTFLSRLACVMEGNAQTIDWLASLTKISSEIRSSHQYCPGFLPENLYTGKRGLDSCTLQPPDQCTQECVSTQISRALTKRDTLITAPQHTSFGALIASNNKSLQIQMGFRLHSDARATVPYNNVSEKQVYTHNRHLVPGHVKDCV